MRSALAPWLERYGAPRYVMVRVVREGWATWAEARDEMTLPELVAAYEAIEVSEAVQEILQKHQAEEAKKGGKKR